MCKTGAILPAQPSSYSRYWGSSMKHSVTACLALTQIWCLMLSYNYKLCLLFPGTSLEFILARASFVFLCIHLVMLATIWHTRHVPRGSNGGWSIFFLFTYFFPSHNWPVTGCDRFSSSGYLAQPIDTSHWVIISWGRASRVRRTGEESKASK